METLMYFLSSIYPISEELTSHLVQTLKYRQIKKKDYLLTAGQVSRHVYFILKGLLRCFYVKNDIEVSSWFMKEQDVVFSIESFYSQTPSYESIQAIEDTEVLYITHSELETIYHTYPEFNFIGRILTIKYHKLWAQQLYSIRMRTGPERYQWLMENHAELIQRVNAKDLASYLGVTPFTLSNLKKKYQKDAISKTIPQKANNNIVNLKQ